MRDRPPKKNPRPVAKVRSAHGTRVARRIVCSACGADDTIDFAPRDPKSVLCRRCAFERHGAVDTDDSAARTERVVCSECGGHFDQVWHAKLEPPYVCKDCRSGIVTRQGDRSQGAVRVSPKVLRSRRRGPEAEE